MNCPYCYKRVGDMPNHLKKNSQCKEKHTKKLRGNFSHVLYHEFLERKSQKKFRKD